jgi:hypothetical protein
VTQTRARPAIHERCRGEGGHPRAVYDADYDAAYEKRSVAISSNLYPSWFDEQMPKALATATVDRPLHHAHGCQTSGDSVGLTQALVGQRVSRSGGESIAMSPLVGGGRS